MSLSNPRSIRELHIFCDFETEMAYVRVFQYINYSWGGGKVYEFKRNGKELTKLAEYIKKYEVENKDIVLQRDIFFNGKTEKAVVYKLNLSQMNEKAQKKHNEESMKKYLNEEL